MLSVKQGDIKNHFLSLWYDSTCDWTPTNEFGKGMNLSVLHISQSWVNNKTQCSFILVKQLIKEKEKFLFRLALLA